MRWGVWQSLVTVPRCRQPSGSTRQCSRAGRAPCTQHQKQSQQGNGWPKLEEAECYQLSRIPTNKQAKPELQEGKSSPRNCCCTHQDTQPSWPKSLTLFRFKPPKHLLQQRRTCTSEQEVPSAQPGCC